MKTMNETALREATESAIGALLSTVLAGRAFSETAGRDVPRSRQKATVTAPSGPATLTNKLAGERKASQLRQRSADQGCCGRSAACAPAPLTPLD